MFETLKEKISVMNYRLILLYITLSIIGVFIIYSADYVSAIGSIRYGYYSKQIIFMCIGLLLFFFFSFSNYRTWVHYSLYIYILGLGLLLFVLYFSDPINNARSWIDLGVFAIQPSELMKVATILMLAAMFINYNGELMGFIKVAKYFIPVAVSVILIAMQPDEGTALIYVAMFGMLLFAIGIRIYVLIGLSIMTLISMPIFWMIMKPYQRERILVILDPARDPFNTGYQVIQSKIAIGSGGLFGSGYLQGTQSHLNFIPYPHNDFIFTITGEEFGFRGTMVIIALMLALLYTVYTSAYSVREMPAKVIIIATSALIFIQFIINTYMVIGLIPVIGIPFPFLSYGGSSYLTFAILLGIVHSIHIDRRLQS